MSGSTGGGSDAAPPNGVLPSTPHGTAAAPLGIDALAKAAAESPLSPANFGALRVGHSATGQMATAQPSMREWCGADLADDVPEEVGASGEYFIFAQLQRLLPDFVRSCWLSKFKLQFFPGENGIENELGADFRYHDCAGKLTGSGKSELVFIEVKSLTQECIAPFRMSIGEWKRAKSCHESGGQQVYVLAVVTSVTRSPRLAALIVDPVQQVTAGGALCEVSELIYSLAAEGVGSSDC
uniref:Protein NO VEIN C-terminal domain-containing protein n=1 Tax=Haptolina brevifila TaxID=156173 RepID=A0A7S2DJR9_9EUKA